MLRRMGRSRGKGGASRRTARPAWLGSAAKWFAIVLLGFTSAAGLLSAVGTVMDYHALTTRGVQTAAIVDRVWRVKASWYCSVSFTDTAGIPHVETVSSCANVPRGQSISVTYDRSNPSVVDPTGSVTAPKMFGLAALLVLFSAATAFGVWTVSHQRTLRDRREARAWADRQRARRSATR